MRWHRLARLAAAAIGLAAAGLVVTRIGTRPPRVAQTPPERLDPRATVESTGAITSEIRGVKEDYQVKAAHQLMYEDGTSKSLDVQITVKDRGGRDFMMSGQEARAGAGNASLDLTGRVHLRASDGFEIETDDAHYAEQDGLVRAPGAFAFHRGRMQGSGVGMVYDKGADVLAITSAARITFLDEAGAVVTDVSGGSATLERAVHILTIDGGAHAVRGEQALDASRLLSTLSEDNEHVTFMELRGDARVAGGSAAFDSMSAAGIDLAYNDDGSILERVSLDGTAAVAMAGEPGGAGRQVFGDRIGIALSGGDTVTGLSGLGHVRLDLPATATAPLRSITAHELAGAGAAPKGLTDVLFSGGVVFRETPAGAGAVPRTARSATLQLGLDGDTVGKAAFSGSVTFEQQGLRAGGGEADYDPSAGTLVIRGGDGAGAPRVEDPRVSVTSDRIAVTLDSHQMAATGHVQTVLREAAGEGGGQLPGLLDRSQAARVSAGTFAYAGGDGGQAVYTGNVQLWQGETTIRADRLVLDRDSGDLDASGTARATLTLESGTMIGRADRIHYADTSRAVEYLGRKGSTADTQLSGPQGDLRADRIVLALAAASPALDHMDASGRVVLKVDGRTVTGARLRYGVATDQYDIEGTPGTPVTIAQGCDSTTGRALTWFRRTDRMLVDGREDIRTSTKSRSGPCPEPRSR
ncbi:MAG: LptA/OstA family protein [Vicinamibacterales bacterium]|nr:LptA/OstA family protein [Vicinamibacterales bacterium]